MGEKRTVQKLEASTVRGDENDQKLIVCKAGRGRVGMRNSHVDGSTCMTQNRQNGCVFKDFHVFEKTFSPQLY